MILKFPDKWRSPPDALMHNVSFKHLIFSKLTSEFWLCDACISTGLRLGVSLVCGL